MSRSTGRNSRLQDRDYEILAHVRRYRLTTPEILHRYFFDADVDRNAVTKVTSKLCKNNFLVSQTLYAGYTYFHLGRSSATILGLKPHKLKPLGSQSLYREYGTLAYCCSSPQMEESRQDLATPRPLRERLEVTEIEKRFPQYFAKGIDSSHYYLDQYENQVRLGYIWVEGAGNVDHVVRKVENDIINERRVFPALRKLIDNGQFLVAVVTLTEEKKSEISLALSRLRSTVFFRVEVVPELRQLLPRVWHE